MVSPSMGANLPSLTPGYETTVPNLSRSKDLAIRNPLGKATRGMKLATFASGRYRPMFKPEALAA